MASAADRPICEQARATTALHTQGGGVAWIEVGGQREGRAGIDESAPRGACRPPLWKETPGQQRRHGGGAAEGQNVGRGGVLEMRDAHGQVLDGRDDGGGGRWLVPMDLASEAQTASQSEIAREALRGNVAVPNQVGEVRQTAAGGFLAANSVQTDSSVCRRASSPFSSDGRRSRNVASTSSGVAFQGGEDTKYLQLGALIGAAAGSLASTVVVPWRAMASRWRACARLQPLVGMGTNQPRGGPFSSAIGPPAAGKNQVRCGSRRSRA